MCVFVWGCFTYCCKKTCKCSIQSLCLSVAGQKFKSWIAHLYCTSAEVQMWCALVCSAQLDSPWVWQTAENRIPLRGCEPVMSAWTSSHLPCVLAACVYIHNDTVTCVTVLCVCVLSPCWGGIYFIQVQKEILLTLCGYTLKCAIKNIY